VHDAGVGSIRHPIGWRITRREIIVPAPDQNTVQNRLLAALGSQDFAALGSCLTLVDLPTHFVLVESEERTQYVYFIESGLASVVASSGTETVEVGHIGNEGVSGTHVLLMTDITSNKTFMQAAGSGWRISTNDFKNILAGRPETQELLLRYVHSCELQLAHSALANARYNMSQRLARWLLMCHDRIKSDHLPLTHEFLSIMLGVRRPSVTDQLHILEGEHAIKVTRGNIHIMDRDKLLDIAGGCYGIPEREYERLIAEAMKRSPVPASVA
jgi:CRP-like cAMP-binding protein